MGNFSGLFVLVLFAGVCQGLPQLNPFVSNGNDAYAGQFPYFVSVIEKLPLIKEQIKCGGSIINKEWIVTSGRCVKPLIGKLSIKAGQSNRSNDGEYVQKRDVQFVIVHSDLSGGIVNGIKQNDIALLKLSKPLLLNERVQAIKLAEDECSPNEKVTLIGIGAINGDIIPKYAESLQYAKVEVLSEGLCNDAISSVSSINEGLLTDDNICTGPLDSAVTVCLGDLGSPLVRTEEAEKNEEEKPELVGIVSWGAIPCGKKGTPIVYTKVSSFVNWINKRIEENSNQLKEY